MADTKWTKEQERAISDRGKGIIVSAAAGSGKTTVLIERMIQLLSDEKNKIPADRLLAVTFTKEAASNMKEKLSRAFDEQLRRDPENKWLLSQQNLIQLARISTINSFCLDLVKSNLHEFDFQGGLDILDDSVQNLILQE
ncbi:UvrD-helicase domain-containing protein, partial [Ruminococcus bicirculans (ex Wegman et al. 2014)]|uniref:UvrD-helicase domain-containing protein n=3 Tax=Ruminococcus TaxID=1263 RepID=UPI003A8E6C52